MVCRTCGGKGHVQGSVMRNGQAYPMVVRCPKCRDIKAYSDEIKAKYGSKETEQEKINRILGR